MCTHTLSIIERLTVNLTTQGATLAPPGPTLTFLNPVRVNLFFSMCSCYHCSCEVVMQFFVYSSDLQTTIPWGR